MSDFFDQPAQIEVMPSEEDEWKPPPYGVPGRILLHVTNTDVLEFEVHDYDVDTSVFWLNEGIGFEYGITDLGLGLDLSDFPTEGWYVIEGVVGHYHRGDGWMTDDDEEWECGTVRAATEQEIREECLREEMSDGCS